MNSFTPRSLISGHVKAAPGRELASAAAAAAAVLGTENIALIHSRTQNDIWYLAAPAADLASHPTSTTPLAAALPGAKDHEGDGAYVSDLAAGLQAIIVKQGEHLHSFVGTPAMVKRFAALEGANTSHTCAGQGMPWQLPAGATQRREARLTTALTASGLLLAVLAAGAWLGAARDASHPIEWRDALRQDQLKVWAAAVGTLESQVYPKALADLQKAIHQASREKGVLVKFEHQDGRSVWTLNIDNRLVTGVSN